MRATFSKIISFLGLAIAIAFIATIVGYFIFTSNRSDQDIFANLIRMLGCKFDIYAVPLLAFAVALQAAALFLRIRELSAENPQQSIGGKLKLAFGKDLKPNEFRQSLSATSSFLMVIFFVTQLSYLLNRCE